jgi:hypothetical protein
MKKIVNDIDYELLSGTESIYTALKTKAQLNTKMSNMSNKSKNEQAKISNDRTNSSYQKFI